LHGAGDAAPAHAARASRRTAFASPRHSVVSRAHDSIVVSQSPRHGSFDFAAVGGTMANATKPMAMD
jgi:hypothetical protein